MAENEQQPKALSPTPLKTESGDKQVKFSDALDLMLLGKKMHKLEWKDKNVYGLIDDSILKLHKEDNKLYQWIVSEGDIAGEDYIIIP